MKEMIKDNIITSSRAVGGMNAGVRRVKGIICSFSVFCGSTHHRT
jgi:hypothetical protein